MYSVAHRGLEGRGRSSSESEETVNRHRIAEPGDVITADAATWGKDGEEGETYDCDSARASLSHKREAHSRFIKYIIFFGFWIDSEGSVTSDGRERGGGSYSSQTTVHRTK